MGKRKKEKDIDARLYEMAMRFQRSNQSMDGGKAEHHEGLSTAALQMAMDDDARVRWQQGLTEDMKYLILLIRQCLEENASLRESVSGLGDGSDVQIPIISGCIRGSRAWGRELGLSRKRRRKGSR